MHKKLLVELIVVLVAILAWFGSLNSIWNVWYNYITSKYKLHNVKYTISMFVFCKFSEKRTGLWSFFFWQNWCVVWGCWNTFRNWPTKFDMCVFVVWFMLPTCVGQQSLAELFLHAVLFVRPFQSLAVSFLWISFCWAGFLAAISFMGQVIGLLPFCSTQIATDLLCIGLHLKSFVDSQKKN